MNCPRHQLLARSALPGDQHGGCGRGGLRDGTEDLDHGRGVADQTARGQWREVGPGLELTCACAAFRAPFAQLPELVIGKRFGKIFFRAGFYRLHCARYGGVTGDHHYLGVGEVFTHVADKIKGRSPWAS